MSSPDDAARLARFNQAFAQGIPHNLALGLRFARMHELEVEMILPYDARLVGNPQTGVLHGGAITSLMDAACGAAVFMRTGREREIATLDLRIDYLKPATPPRDVVCRASCFKVTRSVAFVRALAFHDDPQDPVAAASGSFIVFASEPRLFLGS